MSSVALFSLLKPVVDFMVLVRVLCYPSLFDPIPFPWQFVIPVSLLGIKNK